MISTKADFGRWTKSFIFWFTSFREKPKAANTSVAGTTKIKKTGKQTMQTQGRAIVAKSNVMNSSPMMNLPLRAAFQQDSFVLREVIDYFRCEGLPKMCLFLHDWEKKPQRISSEASHFELVFKRLVFYG
jgi:hypothetical protein